jgi:two-component system nitrate/nitrite response regulator NarL
MRRKDYECKSMDKTFSGNPLSSRVTPLTQRETQILALLTNGLKNKEIAQAMGITEGTVKCHLCRLFQKVGVKGRFELALFCLKNRPTVQPPSRLAIVARKAGSSA